MVGEVEWLCLKFVCTRILSNRCTTTDFFFISYYGLFIQRLLLSWWVIYQLFTEPDYLSPCRFLLDADNMLWRWHRPQALSSSRFWIRCLVHCLMLPVSMKQCGNWYQDDVYWYDNSSCSNHQKSEQCYRVDLRIAEDKWDRITEHQQGHQRYCDYTAIEDTFWAGILRVKTGCTGSLIWGLRKVFLTAISINIIWSFSRSPETN